MPKLPEKIEDWTAPWEKEGAELDPARVKKLAFDLLRDQEQNRAKLAELKTTVQTLTDERDQARDALEDTGKSADAKAGELAEARKEARRLERELAAATQSLSELKKRAGEADRFDVALENGLSKSQAKRLVGDTIDELRADAEQLRADLGLPPVGDDGEPGGFNGGQSPFIFHTAQRLKTGGERFSAGNGMVDPKSVEAELPPV